MINEINKVKVLGRPKFIYYTWNNIKWSSFMMKIMRLLEPRQYLSDQVIYRDLEEVHEIIFVTAGHVSGSSLFINL